MATTQTDTVAMTEQQLDGVSGGPHYSNWNAPRHNVMQRSNSTMDTGRRASLVPNPAVTISPAFVSVPWWRRER